MVSYEGIDLSTLSRRELQALCKGNGIPANKTNVFMVDALAKKRAPLSKMDSNRDQKVVTSVGKKSNASDVNSSNPIEQKPVLFQNNFLRRGKRKDVPALRESGDEPKVHGTGNAQRPHQTLSTKAKAESDSISETLPGTAARQSNVDTRLSSGNRSGTAAERPDVKPSIVPCPDDSAFDASRNVVKQKIDDRVRSQIDAALCSKVKKPSPPEQQGNILQDKLGNCAILSMLGHPEQQMESFCLEHPLACQIVTKEETAPFPLSPIVRAEEKVLSVVAPLPLSPLIRAEKKVLSVVERIQNFWNGSRDLVVKSFGSPEEVVNG